MWTKRLSYSILIDPFGTACAATIDRRRPPSGPVQLVQHQCFIQRSAVPDLSEESTDQQDPLIIMVTITPCVRVWGSRNVCHFHEAAHAPAPAGQRTRGNGIEEDEPIKGVPTAIQENY